MTELEDINKFPEIKHKILEANEIMMFKLFLLLTGMMMMKAGLAIAECLHQEESCPQGHLKFYRPWVWISTLSSLNPINLHNLKIPVQVWLMSSDEIIIHFGSSGNLKQNKKRVKSKGQRGCFGACTMPNLGWENVQHFVLR